MKVLLKIFYVIVAIVVIVPVGIFLAIVAVMTYFGDGWILKDMFTRPQVLSQKIEYMDKIEEVGRIEKSKQGRLSVEELRDEIDSPKPTLNKVPDWWTPDKVGLIEKVFDGEPKIFVSSATPESWAEEISKSDRLNAFQVILKMASEDNGTLTASDSMQSVLYYIPGEIDDGSVITTSYTYTRSKESYASSVSDKPLTEEFVQTVLPSTNRNPFIIINGTFSKYKGDFIYKVDMNGETLMQREVVVPSDI